jgi:hypothetical protein
MKRALLLAALISIPARASAQAWTVPLGGRTATMGAAVAEGHDLAMPLLNPAGVAAVDVQVFGLTSSIYAYGKEKTPRYFAPDGFHPVFGQAEFDDPGLVSKGLSIVPSGVGMFRHVGRARTDEPGHFVLGISALSPVERASSATGRFVARLPDLNGSIDRTTALSETLLDLYVGPVAGLVVSRRVRIGMSLMALYRRRYVQSETTSTQTQSGGNDFADYRDSSFIDSTSLGAIAIAGVQIEPVDHLWLGLSAQSPSVQMTGSETQRRSQILFLSVAGFTPTNLVDTRNRDLAFTSKESLRLSGGLAYVLPKQLAIAADVMFRPATLGLETASGTSIAERTITGSATRRVEESYARSIDGKTTLDFAFGGELYLGKQLALRAGYSQATDPRELPAIGEETVNMTRRSVRTISAGLGLVVGPFDTTFGLAWQHTTGTIDVKDLYGRQPAADSSYPGFLRLDLSGDSVMFTLSATVSEEEARQKLLDRVQGAAGIKVGGAVSIGIGVATCPKSLDASAIAEFDYTPLVEGSLEDAQSIKAGLVALADLATVTERISADLQETCTAIVNDLEGKKGAFDSPAAACTAAEGAIAAAKKKLGPDAHLEIALVPAVCTISMAPLNECLKACGPSGGADISASATCESAGPSGTCSVEGLAILGGATCSLRCEARARAKATCNSAGIKVDITGAADEAVAATLRSSLSARLPALSRSLAIAASKSKDLPKQALAIVDAVRATAQALVDRSPAASASLVACVTGPAADFGARIDRFGASVAAGKRVSDAALK